MAFGKKEESGGDIAYRKLFVGGLAWETQTDTLRRYFERFGDILEAVVITDKNTGRSRGYGFVTFRDPLSAERACANRAPIIDGRKANCNLAYFGQTHSPLPSSGRFRPAIPVAKGVQNTIGTYVGTPYQPVFVYPPYGYITYGPGLVYPQGVYNSSLGQRYVQVYEASSGTINSGPYSHGQLSLPLAGGLHSYGIPGQNNVRFGGSTFNGIVVAAIPMIQSPYPGGTVPGGQSPYPTGVSAAAPGQTQMAVPAQSPIPSCSVSSKFLADTLKVDGNSHILR